MWLLRLRYSLRSLARDPAFVLIVVLVFSLGVAANTILLTVIDQILLHPLPYRDPDGLVMIWEANHSLDEPQASRGRVAWNNFREWQTQTDVFDAIEAHEQSVEYNLTDRGNPERLVAARASTGFFRMLGVQTQQGRTFLPEDAGSNSVVLISAAFAKNRFARQNPLGEKLLLNGIPRTIIGVLPASFHLMSIFEGAFEYKPEIWVPLPPVTAADPPTETRVRRFLVTARLKHGVTLAQARAEMQALAARLELSDPGLNTGYSVNLVPLKVENADPDLGRSLYILWAAAFTVLLLGCLNGSGLMLVRFVNRQRDLAIMDALGAPRRVLIANVLTESFMFAVVAAALAWGACYAGIALIRALQPISIYGASRLHLDMRSFVLSSLISLLCVVLLGVLPAWIYSRRTFKSSLRQAASFGSARWGSLVRRVLVCTEIAITLVLGVGAMLLTRSFQRLLEVDPGWYRPQNLVTGRIALVPPHYATDDDRERFCEQLLDRVRRLPGVESASLADNFPLYGPRYNWFEIEGRAIAKPGSAPSTDYAAVTSDFFQTMGTPLRSGRLFTAADMQKGATDVAILNEGLARKYWPNQDPIGAHVRMIPPRRDPGPWRVVVGVVGDYRQFNMETPARPQLFWPARQFSEMTVVARTANDPAATLAALPKVVAELDKDQPVADVLTLQSRMNWLNSQYRFNMLVLSALAGLGIVLALGGVYGLISYVISSHQHDLGIRLALGAQRKHVFSSLLRQILPFAAIGVGLGLLLSLLTKKLIADLLFEISALDPATYIALPIALMTLAVLTCALPAWRVARMNPVTILRQE
jgi:predicted permease